MNAVERAERIRKSSSPQRVAVRYGDVVIQDATVTVFGNERRRRFSEQLVFEHNWMTVRVAGRIDQPAGPELRDALKAVHRPLDLPHGDHRYAAEYTFPTLLEMTADGDGCRVVLGLEFSTPNRVRSVGPDETPPPEPMFPPITGSPESPESLERFLESVEDSAKAAEARREGPTLSADPCRPGPERRGNATLADLPAGWADTLQQAVRLAQWPLMIRTEQSLAGWQLGWKLATALFRHWPGPVEAAAWVQLPAGPSAAELLVVDFVGPDAAGLSSILTPRLAPVPRPTVILTYVDDVFELGHAGRLKSALRQSQTLHLRGDEIRHEVSAYA